MGQEHRSQSTTLGLGELPAPGAPHVSSLCLGTRVLGLRAAVRGSGDTESGGDTVLSGVPSLSGEGVIWDASHEVIV